MSSRTKLVKGLFVAVMAVVLLAVALPACAPEEQALDEKVIEEKVLKVLKELEGKELPRVEEKVTEWNMHCGYSLSYYIGAGVKHLADTVAAKTDGRVKINVYYSSGLGYSGVEVAAAVKDGALEVASVDGPVHAAEIAPWWGFYDFYCQYENVHQMMYVDQVMNPISMEAIENYGGILVWLQSSTPASIIQGFWTNKEINSLADLKGLKCRVYYPRAIKYQLAPLGISGMYIPGAETYQAMKTGLVDMILHSATAGITSHYNEISQYFYAFEVMAKTIWGTMINEDVFYALPEDLQVAVREACEEHAAFLYDEIYFRACDFCPGYGGDYCGPVALEVNESQGITNYRSESIRAEFHRLGVEGAKAELADEMADSPEYKIAYEALLEAKAKYPGFSTSNEGFMGLEDKVLR